MSKRKHGMSERFQNVAREWQGNQDDTTPEQQNIVGTDGQVDVETNGQLAVTPERQGAKATKPSGATRRIAVRVDRTMLKRINREVYNRKQNDRPRANIQGVLHEALVAYFHETAE